MAVTTLTRHSRQGQAPAEFILVAAEGNDGALVTQDHLRDARRSSMASGAARANDERMFAVIGGLLVENPLGDSADRCGRSRCRFSIWVRIKHSDRIGAVAWRRTRPMLEGTTTKQRNAVFLAGREYVRRTIDHAQGLLAAPAR
jgi:hypothetical protein